MAVERDVIKGNAVTVASYVQRYLNYENLKIKLFLSHNSRVFLGGAVI